jgi:MYXO-CTERM domain-containing protein
MRKTLGTLAAVAVLAGATNAWAADEYLMTDLTAPASIGGGPEAIVNSDFEPPAFVPGPITVVGQNGWIQGNQPGWSIDNTTPIAGLQDATHVPTGVANQLSRLISPTDASPAFGNIQSALVRFDTLAANGSYGLELLNSGTTINARVLLMPDGDIEVLQAPGGTGVFTDIGDFAPGVAVKLGIQIGADGSQRVYINDVLSFTGQDIQFQVTGGVTLLAPNRAVGNGFWGVANAASRGSVDDFTTVVPEPAALGLAAVAATGLIRRRRA